MTAEPCPTCGQPTLTAVDGTRLDAATHPLAIRTITDGVIRRLTTREVMAGIRGHHEHRCPPAEQGTLFGGGGA